MSCVYKNLFDLDKSARCEYSKIHVIFLFSV